MSGVQQVETTKHKVVSVTESSGSQGVEKVKVQKIPTTKFQSIAPAQEKKGSAAEKVAASTKSVKANGADDHITIPDGKEIAAKTSSLAGLKAGSTKNHRAVSLFYMGKVEEVLAIDEQIKELRAQRSEIMNETKKVATKAATNELIKMMKMDDAVRQDKLSELFKVLDLSGFVDFSISQNGFYSDTLFAHVQDEIKHLNENGDFAPAPLPEPSKKSLVVQAENGEADAENGVVH